MDNSYTSSWRVVNSLLLTENVEASPQRLMGFRSRLPLGSHANVDGCAHVRCICDKIRRGLNPESSSIRMEDVIYLGGGCRTCDEGVEYIGRRSTLEMTV